jgi:mono/diheme cytochrome c family protein
MVKKYILFLLFFLFILRTVGFSQSAAAAWIVPDEAKGKVCPFRFTPETVKSGENVFQRNCKSCHGDPGKQNWAKIVPPPGDPASATFQQQTAGEMFFRISTGKTPMPQFGNILSEEERWQVISYLRSFNPGYTQPQPALNTAKGEKNLDLKLFCNYKKKQLYVLCREVTKEKKIPARGIDIQLNVKRYFSSMRLGDPKTTNAAGMAIFDFPSDLPGGRFGILEISVSVKDESGMMNSNTVNAKLAIGKPILLKSLTEGRAMWSVRSKAPVWLILTFSLTMLTVWGLIFYILFSLKKMTKANSY